MSDEKAEGPAVPVKGQFSIVPKAGGGAQMVPRMAGQRLGPMPGRPSGPVLPKKIDRLSKQELSTKVHLMERQIASLQRHAQLEHGTAQAALKEAKEAMTFLGALFKTLTRKGLVVEQDLADTYSELRKESEKRRRLEQLEADAKKGSALRPPGSQELMAHSQMAREASEGTPPPGGTPAVREPASPAPAPAAQPTEATEAPKTPG